ncbi:formyltransferase family protein [Parvularcula lutaonensis]|uniref:Formyltransferase family protein n=1 Tax=Parvularcula lutaonensis TaxID=491923 RepID=A0ABV7MCI1_9PROT|nr:formyltransferase family protein [Parvularcula lutaonensis]GGY50897.1 hypothetical protein GCM10007148_19650 [Parvularcula lutaonensis]
MSFDRRIIFLCGKAEGEAFRAHVASVKPDLETVWVSSVAGLDFATRSGGHRTRLISFLTGVIVPKTILDRLRPQPINVHPGPPEYPGAHGLTFAIFNGAHEFGVTAHEMAAKVDAGPILQVARFALPSDADLVGFGNEVYARAVSVVNDVINHCIETDGPMPHAPRERWSDNHCTNKRLNALLTASEYLLPEDRKRLVRACGPHLEEFRRAQRRHG